MSKHGVGVAASSPRQLQYIVFSSPVDSTVILHIHPAMTDLSTFRRAVALTRPFSGPVGYFQKRMFQKSSQHG